MFLHEISASRSLISSTFKMKVVICVGLGRVTYVRDAIL